MTKHHPPERRDLTLLRERLMEVLRRGARCRLTLVAAPAGSGKTTLLATWRELEATRRPVAWVSLNDGDNDPVVLWAGVIGALRRVCPFLGDATPPELVGTAPLVEVLLPRLVNALAEQDDLVLILDDFHRLSSGEARDSVAWFVEHAPSTFQLVLSTRVEPPFPLAALRAHGELLELRADDLRFSFVEADALLNGLLGLGLAVEEIESLVERTEGWPAGLYLAALSLARVEDRHAYIGRFGATSRHVVDFLTEEVLETSDPATLDMMLRSSILERFCGPLCDAVLEQNGSTDRLAALARTNLFLVPLDDEGNWYRFHHLFGELLRMELERRDPNAAVTLQRRAYVWHCEHGTTDEAIHYALEAGGYVEAGDLIAAAWVRYANAHKLASIIAFLQRFPADVLHGDARLLLAKAWMLWMAGQREEGALAIAAVEQLDRFGEGPLPDGFSSVEASLTLLKATCPWGDVGAQTAAAKRAAELEGPVSPWRPVVCWVVGWGRYYNGDHDEADRWFKESASLAHTREQWVVGASSLAYRSFIAGDRGQHEEQRLIAEEAAALARDHGLDELNGLVHVALGLSLAERGRADEALPLVERGVAVVRRRREPVDLAEALLRQLALLQQVGEHERAGAVLAEARAVIDSCPDPGALPARLAALEPQRRDRRASRDDELSERELTVLRLLSGPLSERDIGRELYLSHSTIHGHVRSIYRKLGVSSRAAALERARGQQLL
ncbi:MAG TPA: LuxR C-terminal-related transcriptional regulator [Gaiellaceae bacterium]|nr:LuxR C-terminal-related transcriptional regulator [Gaiellaceae bacterium]